MAEVSDFIFRPFEKEIIDAYKAPKTFGMGGIGGRSASRKGLWIRGYLELAGEDYILNMFRIWRNFTTKAAKMGNAIIKPGTYQNFRTYFWILEQTGLVIKTREGKSTRGKNKIPRSYYSLRKEEYENNLWLNPFSKYH